MNPKPTFSFTAVNLPEASQTFFWDLQGTSIKILYYLDEPSQNSSGVSFPEVLSSSETEKSTTPLPVFGQLTTSV